MLQHLDISRSNLRNDACTRLWEHGDRDQIKDVLNQIGCVRKDNFWLTM
jgi:hypothetical protein